MRIGFLLLLFAANCLAQQVVPNRRINFQPVAGGGGGGNTVTFDAVGPTSSGAQPSGGETAPICLTWTHTNNSQSHMLLVVGVARSDNTTTRITNVTCSTSSTTNNLTEAAYTYSNNSTTSGHTALWYLLNPPNGTNFIRVWAATLPAGTTIGGSVTFYNVHQTTPVSQVTTNSGNSASPSVTSSGSGAQDFVIGVNCDGSGFTANGQTLRVQLNKDLFSGAGNIQIQTQAGGGSGTISGTAPSDFWGGVALRVNHD